MESLEHEIVRRILEYLQAGFVVAADEENLQKETEENLRDIVRDALDRRK